MTMTRQIPADAPCILVFDPSGKIPSYVRWGEFRKGWAQIPHDLPRRRYADLAAALRDARKMGLDPTRWAEPGKPSRPLPE